MKLYLHENIIDSLENIENRGSLISEDDEFINVEIGRFCRSIYPGIYYCRINKWEENGKSIESIDFGSYSKFLILIK